MAQRTCKILVGMILLVSLLVGGWFGITHSTARAAVQATFYVAPDGSDSNAGTQAQPFATLAKARDVVRGMNGNMSGDIIVYLRGGTYTQSQTLQLTQADSGTNGYNVIYQAYPGETPVISGATRITGWTQVNSSQNIWSANVGTGLQTRSLFVNGLRAVRAKRYAGLPGTITQTSTGYTTTDTTPQSWSNPGSIELSFTGKDGNHSAYWVDSRCPVASITGDSSSTTITVQQPCYNNARSQNGGVANPTSIENSYSFLDQPGEWFLDNSAGVLYYIPRSGENMSSATVLAGTTESLITGSGTDSAPINHIQLKGITFAYNTWLLPNTSVGYANLQDGAIFDQNGSVFKAPASVMFHHPQYISVENCVFRHLGMSGVSFDQGAQHNSVTGNLFTDLSGNGVIFGDLYSPNATGSAQTIYNTVSDNYLHEIGVEYRSNSAIWVTLGAHITVTHNEISTLPYNAIVLGYDGGSTNTSYANSNEIAYNHIHDFNSITLDGGGIYLWGEQGTSATSGRSSVHDNYVYNQWNDYGGIYTDWNTTYIDFFNNVVPQTHNWFFAWSNTNHDFNIHDNYTDSSSGYYNQSVNSTVTNNYTGGEPWPSAAQNIIANAGLESAYRSLLTSAGPTSGSNLAQNKPTSDSSEYDPQYTSALAVDNNPATNWVSVWGSGQHMNVDLLQAATISKIELVTRQDIDQADQRENFEIWASDNDDMQQHVVLKHVGTGEIPFQGTLTVDVTDTHPYRYLRIIKVADGTLCVAELRVFSSTSSPSNISQGKPATSSSDESSSLGPGNAVDGNLSTRWGSQFSDPQWIQVDLGAVYSISEVKLVWESAYGKSYQIQVSNDASNWTTIYSTTNGQGGTEDLTGLSGSGRYIRMYGTVRGTSWGYSLWEFDIFGSTSSPSNISQGKPATSSSDESSSLGPGNAVDGNLSTRWSSQFSDPQWIQVDLGAVHSISEVKLVWESAYGKSYQIQVSNDASNWTTIYSTTNGQGGTEDLTGLSGSGRYIRMYGTVRGTSWGYSLWEFDVFGS